VVLQAHDEVQQARARESLYREKLSVALEENRVQHAEISELRRQCDSCAALSESWRAASKESALSLSSYEASLRIAREEAAMLEHSLRRLEDENIRLKDALRYADKIVYGEKSGFSSAAKKSDRRSSAATPNGKAWVPNGVRSNKENSDNSRRHAYFDAVSTPVAHR
jgi:hypothetical protein